ncbi:MAG: hypothetical protein WCK67_09415 [bacterium]
MLGNLSTINQANISTSLKSNNNVQNKAVALNNSQALKSDAVSFKGDKEQEKTKYENPVNRKWEMGLAAYGAIALSVVLGAGAAFVTHKGLGLPVFADKVKNKGLWTAVAGVATTVVTGLLSIPGAMYNANVTGFVKQKEMDVFSRDRSFQTNVMEKLDKQVKDPEADLDKSLTSYMKLQMGKNGSSQTLGLMNVN